MKKIEMLLPDAAVGSVLGFVLNIADEIHIINVPAKPSAKLPKPVTSLKTSGRGGTRKPPSGKSAEATVLDYIAKNGSVTAAELAEFGQAVGFAGSTLGARAYKLVQAGKIVRVGDEFRVAAVQ